MVSPYTFEYIFVIIYTQIKNKGKMLKTSIKSKDFELSGQQFHE